MRLKQNCSRFPKFRSTSIAQRPAVTQADIQIDPAMSDIQIDGDQRGVIAVATIAAIRSGIGVIADEPFSLQSFPPLLAWLVPPPRLEAPNFKNLFRVMANTDRFGRDFSIVVPVTAEEETGYRIQLRLQNWTWKLVGIGLPDAVQTKIVEEIIRKEMERRSGEMPRVGVSGSQAAL